MKYKTLFRLVLRLIGVYLCIQAVLTIVSQVAIVQVWSAVQGRVVQWTPSIPTVIAALARVVAGAYLFFGGEWIVNLAIPANRPYCPECGYDLTGAPGPRCPECDTPFRKNDVRPPDSA